MSRRRGADLLVNAAPLTDAPEGSSTGPSWSCRTSPARIELEAALKQQRELAEEASRHKTRLVSALSHDVRTPLNAVVLAAQLLEIHFDGERRHRGPGVPPDDPPLGPQRPRPARRPARPEQDRRRGDPRRGLAVPARAGPGRVPGEHRAPGPA